MALSERFTKKLINHQEIAAQIKGFNDAVRTAAFNGVNQNSSADAHDYSVLLDWKEYLPVNIRTFVRGILSGDITTTSHPEALDADSCLRFLYVIEGFRCQLESKIGGEIDTRPIQLILNKFKSYNERRVAA